MLEAFLGLQDILLDQVTQHVLHHLQCYKHHNTGAKRGTAIVARVQNVQMVPSGRDNTAKSHEVWVTNVYAPFGSMKQERNRFFSSEVPHLLPGALDQRQSASRETDIFEMDFTEQVEGVEDWVGAIKLVRSFNFSWRHAAVDVRNSCVRIRDS